MPQMSNNISIFADFDFERLSFQVYMCKHIPTRAYIPVPL
jgi:hypothetical protein